MAVVQNVKNSCDKVLTSVRDSSLNFSLQETPFSIYITIRKSFLRCRSDSLDKNPSNYKEEQTSGKSQELEDLITKLKSEEKINLALKNNYEEAIEDSAKCYQRIEDLETQVERLRDSLDKARVTAIDKEGEIQKLRTDNEELKASIGAAETIGKKTSKLLKLKERQIEDLKRENATVTEKLIHVQTDFENLTSKVNKEAKNEKNKLKKDVMKNLKPSYMLVHYECDQCDEKYESLCKLKSHIRTFHMKTFCTQTEEKTVEDKNVQCEREQLVSDKTFQTPEVKKEFENYPCFYCDKDIASELEALEHRVTCHGAADNPSLFSFPVRLSPMLFKCILCGLVASCEADIVKHKKSVHGSQ